MDFNFFIHQLSANKYVFEHLLTHIDPELEVWKLHSDKWCLREIVCHLYDEEREDFRQRFQYILEKPQEDPPPINPPVWVTERRYMEQDFKEKLKAFLGERDHSISYLKGLDNIPWDNVYIHQHFGPITARHYLDNWLAHDLLHIKQITQLKYEYVKAHSDQDMSYAGEWK